MRADIYACIYSDEEEDPEAGLGPVSKFAEARGWEAFGGRLDERPSAAQAVRSALHAVLEEAGRSRLAMVLVWRSESAVCSPQDVAMTLEMARNVGAGMSRSGHARPDRTSAHGEALAVSTVAYAQPEEFLGKGAQGQGRRIGRPRVTDRPGFQEHFRAVLERLQLGQMSRRQAARELGIGYATLKRLLDGAETTT